MRVSSVYIILYLLIVLRACFGLKVNTVTKNISSIRQTTDELFENYSSLTVIASFSGVTFQYIPKLNLPVDIYSNEYILKNCYKLPIIKFVLTGFILLVDDFEERTFELVKCVRLTVVFPPEIDVLIIHVVASNCSNCFQDEYVNFLAKLWDELSLSKVVILAIHDDSVILNFIYSYNPFLNKYALFKSCNHLKYECHHWTEVIDKSHSLLNISLYDRVSMVMSNRFKKLNGYYITIKCNAIPAQWIGTFEHDMVRFFNIRFSKIFPSLNELEEVDNFKLSNGKIIVHNVTYYLETKLFDNQIAHDPKYKLIFRFAHPIQEYPIGFLMRQKPSIESWRIFNYIFQLKLWVALLLTCILTNFMFIFFKSSFGQFSNVSFIKKAFQSCILVTKTFLSVGLDKVSTQNSERILLASCFFFGLIFVTIFNSRLYSLMTSKPHPPSLNTLQEVVDSELPITVWDRYFVPTFFTNSILRPLNSRLTIDELGIEQLFKYGNLSVVKENPVFIILNAPTAVSIQKSGPENFHFTKEIVSVVHGTPLTSYYWSHFFNLFNWFVLIYTEHGHTLKSLQDYFISRSMLNFGVNESLMKLLDKKDIDISVNPLSYDMLLLPFYILYIGNVVSCIVFVFEMVYFKYLRLSLD